MNTNRDFLKVIEDLPIVQPSSRWNDCLQTKIQNATTKKDILNSSSITAVAFLILLIVNVFNFITAIEKEKQVVAFKRSKAIANEFLINTNSSKF